MDIEFDKTLSGWTILGRIAKLCSRAEFVAGQEDKPILKRCYNDFRIFHLVFHTIFQNHRDAKGDASEQAILKCMEQIDGNVIDYRKGFPTACEIPFNSTNKYQVNLC